MDTSIVNETRVESKTFVVATYDGAFERWLIEKDHSERTSRLYMIGLRDFSAWFERKNSEVLSPAAITPLDVISYRRYLADERRLKSRSVNSYLAAVRAFCRWAMDKGLIMGDPSSGIKGIKLAESETTPRWLTRQEQYALLRAALKEVQQGDLRARDDKSAPGYVWPRRDRAIIVLMLNSGLRLSEITALDVDDLVIRPRSGEVTVRMGKGRKTRTVRLNRDARAAVQEWLDVRPAGDDKAVFISQKGKKRLTARAIARRVEEIGMQAGLNITPHQLRHSLAKNMVDEGISLDQVRMALGHESMDTTKRYTMPSDSDMQTAMERVAWRD